MANSVGSEAKRTSRLCFTFVKGTTPTAPKTPLPTKFAVAEKHTACYLRRQDYTYYGAMQNISRDAADSDLVGGGRIRYFDPEHLPTVILSEVAAPRSEAAAQSKDPYTPETICEASRHFPHDPCRGDPPVRCL